jgi:threonine dehydratase
VARAHLIAERDGMTLVPSANHAAVIAGQGTIGLEIHEQLADIGIGDDALAVVVPVGLGGLAAGISAALAELRPTARAIGAEPQVAADTRDSLAAGVRTAWPAEQTARTIADGLRGEMPAELPFDIMRRHLAGVVAVEEAEIVSAMKTAAREARLVLEPSGAVALAAFLSHRPEIPGQGPVVIIASGGNVDRQRYVEWLATAD